MVGQSVDGHLWLRRYRQHLTRGSRSFVWDGAGRLRQVWQPSDGSIYGSYRYDPLGRRVKKSWNYVDYSFQRTGSIVYVYGAGGEVLAEYRDEPAGSYGPETSTAYNIHMGSTLVARRVTGALSGVPYSRTEWLHRNHLQGVVGTDYSNMAGCTNCSWSWAYAQAFGSGGSDQFAGHKDDPETGMKYFGARYYHATSARWLSADSLTARVYDPLSLNKYAYVRNDPINKVDLDGQRWVLIGVSRGEGWYMEEYRWYEDNPFQADWLAPMNPPEAVQAGGREFSLAQFLADKEAVSSALKHRIFVGPDGTDRCKDFLLKLIAGLGSRLTAGFNLQTLIDNILIADRQVDPTLRANARTKGNTILMSPNPTERMGNDYVSTLLHEGFHLQMSSSDRSQINEWVLGKAAATAAGYDKEKIRSSGAASIMAKQTFGEKCGPGNFSFIP